MQSLISLEERIENAMEAAKVPFVWACDVSWPDRLGILSTSPTEAARALRAARLRVHVDGMGEMFLLTVKGVNHVS
jgi:hypothetical protein